MKAIKQTIGVDVAQDELVCSFGLLFEDLSWQIKARKTFGLYFPNPFSGYPR